MHALIAVLPGDGIGVEVTDEAQRLLAAPPSMRPANRCRPRRSRCVDVRTRS
jgi:isocitrate/isopropylmalate dehydrogenase